MNKTVVINAVGFTRRLLGQFTPNLARFVARGRVAAIEPMVPGVTTTVQSTYLTGSWPGEHGVVGNGWYFRDECEVKFWRQSNRLVQRPKVWERLRAAEAGFTCANLFWWYNMYSSVDVAVTPRPMYPADGRKLPDIHTHPIPLRFELQRQLGQFPLFQFWGPATSIKATQWIADSAVLVDRQYDPTLTLIYLPHLDYCLQRVGPDAAANAGDLKQLDEVCGRLIEHYEKRGARVIILSEYGIVPVRRAVHINRVLREAGLIAVREELGHELLDAGESAAFAVADHQVAHVYVNDPSKLERVRILVQSTPGVARVLDGEGKRELHLDHERSGELVALAENDAWFTYYYWLDDARAPDFARTVDIHRKPGYDPAELFIDPRIAAPKAKLAWTLLKRKLGLRALMELTPLDAELVKGSHGVAPKSAEDWPMLMTREGGLVSGATLGPTEVADVIFRHVSDRN